MGGTIDGSEKIIDFSTHTQLRLGPVLGYNVHRPINDPPSGLMPWAAEVLCGFAGQ